MASKLQHHLAAVRRFHATGIWLKYGHRKGDFDLHIPAHTSPSTLPHCDKPCAVRERRFLIKLCSSQRHPVFIPVHPNTGTITTITELYEACTGDPVPYVGQNDVLLGTVSFDLLTA